MKGFLPRLRAADGFGLVELMIAVVIMNVSLLALLAAFTNGITTARRSARIATASTLADSQLERYRALKYTAIGLNQGSIDAAGTIYHADSAYRATQVTRTTCSTPLPPECTASQTITGPDRWTYQVDTYIVTMQPANARTVTQVTVVVRDTKNMTAKGLVRRASIFDQSTGL